MQFARIALISTFVVFLFVVVIYSWRHSSTRSTSDSAMVNIAPRESIESFVSLKPTPDMTASQVVQVQLNALRLNDNADRGIETVFTFASPVNRSQTGPLQKFAAMVKSPPYNVMVNHRSAHVVRTDTDGDNARIFVLMIDGDGRQCAFVFLLSRQSDEPFADCWMTEGVSRIGVEQLPRDDGPGLAA